MRLRRLWLLVSMVSVSAGSFASLEFAPVHLAGGQTSLSQREHQVWSSAVHESEFATMARDNVARFHGPAPQCETAALH